VGNVVEPRSLNDSKYKLILENAAEFDVDFDIIISTAPAAQSAQIYAKYDDLVKSLSTVKYNPAFVLMFSLKQSAAVFLSPAVSESISKIRDADILKIKNSIIEEIVFNHKKPLRDSATPAFVIKASKSFTETNLEMEHAWIEEALLNEFFSIMGFNLDSIPELGFKHLHRWLYSTSNNNLEEYADLRIKNLKDRDMISGDDKLESLFLKAKGEEIYAVGDYILGSLGVEASLLSARALARILGV
jgi:predicted NAD/FAD-dependent oxidoreductase